LRKEKGLRQKELAEKTGMSPTTINYYEKDKREPDIERIKKLAEALDVTGGELIGQDQAITEKNISGEEIMFALLDGDVEDITDEMFEDVKRYAQFIKDIKRREADGSK
jgi:transcriptional regulator with XRE-family HTH domain